VAYGFEIRNASNQVVLDSSDTTMRIVHIEYVAYTSCITGNYYQTHTNTPYTFTVSDFDSTRGSYYVRAHTGTWEGGTNQLNAPPMDSITHANYNFSANRPNANITFSGTMWTPGLSWNNSTKVMTFTHPGPANYAYSSTSVPSYDFVNCEVVFLEWA